MRQQAPREHSAALPAPYPALVVGYAVVCCALFLGVLYLTWARVTIALYPAQTAQEREFTFSVAPSGAADALVIAGHVERVIETEQRTFAASGMATREVAPGTVGEVRVVNTTDRAQPLVATTRLARSADPNVVAVRLRSDVTVPAKGAVTAAVYAENEASFVPIDPQRFVFPGLRRELQTQIYAESSQVLTAATGSVPAVTEEDLSAAVQSIKTSVREKALQSFVALAPAGADRWAKVSTVQQSEIAFDAAAGDQRANFVGTAQHEEIVVAFDEAALVAALRKQLRTETGGGQTIALDPASFTYTILQTDPQGRTARIKVTTTAHTQAVADQFGVDRTKLRGLTADEVRAVLADIPNIERVEVEFHPSWLRKTPRISSKIDIEVRE